MRDRWRAANYIFREDAVVGCRRVRELLYPARIVSRKEGMADRTLKDWRADSQRSVLKLWSLWLEEH